MSINNTNGVHRYNYVPSLQGANPVKKDKGKDDWWNEMCQKHNTKNHWKKDKPKSDE